MKGRHVRRRLGRGTTVALVAVAFLLLAGAGTAYGTYQYEQSRLDRILPGVSIDGVAVGGMTRQEAVQALTPGVQSTLAGEVEITTAGHHWTRSLGDLGMHADVDGAVDQALSLMDSYSWMSRAYHRLAHKPIARSFAVRYDVTDAKIRSFVGTAAKQLAISPRNASFTLKDGALSIVHSRPGRALRTTDANSLLMRAVDGRQAAVELTMRSIAPKVPDDKLTQTIVVNLSKNMLYLYDGFKVERSYPVATAKAGFLTPPGSWKVVGKVENPTWHNPAPNGWGAGEPLVIPPGPGNPLGTRALYLDAAGIRIHGTPEDSSIGTYASHGCIRMHISDSEALYPLVAVGTPVFIIGAPPWGITSNPGATGT